MRFSDSPVFESTLEQELALIHRALDGKVPNTKEGRDGFLHEYSKLRARQEELVHCLCREKDGLKRVSCSIEPVGGGCVMLRVRGVVVVAPL